MKITVECNSIKELRDFCFESGYLVTEDRLATAKAAAKESGKYDDNKKITLMASKPEEEATKAPTAEELTASAKKTEKIIEAAEEKIAAEKAKAAESPSASETDVKVLLSKKLKAGKKAEIKELFAAYGVEKLSELLEKHPDKLTEFYQAAGAI